MNIARIKTKYVKPILQEKQKRKKRRKNQDNKLCVVDAADTIF